MQNKNNISDNLLGPIFSIVTPFKEDDSIDYPSIEKYINTIYKSGGRNFFVMAYNSRFGQLSWNEIKFLNEFVTQCVKSKDQDTIVIVADPLNCSTKISLEFALHSERIGADIISLVCREKFYSETQIFKHFDFITKRCDQNILIHQMPFMSGYGEGLVNYPLSLVSDLVQLDRIVAIKEDSKIDQQSIATLKIAEGYAATILSGGGKSRWLELEKYGYKTWLNGIGVFDPRLATTFWRAYLKKDFSYLEKVIELIEKPFFDQCVSKYGWHLSIKAALEWSGIMTRFERLPMMPLNKNEFNEVVRVMESLPIDEIINTDYLFD